MMLAGSGAYWRGSSERLGHWQAELRGVALAHRDVEDSRSHLAMLRVKDGDGLEVEDRRPQTSDMTTFRPNVCIYIVYGSRSATILFPEPFLSIKSFEYLSKSHLPLSLRGLLLAG